jgi:lipoprotein NlpI
MAHSIFPPMPAPLICEAGNTLVMIKARYQDDVTNPGRGMWLYLAILTCGTNQQFLFLKSVNCYTGLISIETILALMSQKGTVNFGDGIAERSIFPELFLYTKYTNNECNNSM